MATDCDNIQDDSFEDDEGLPAEGRDIHVDFGSLDTQSPTAQKWAESFMATLIGNSGPGDRIAVYFATEEG